MSLGSPVRSTSLDEAVKRASADGIHFSVAAGNENQDACNSSPASSSKGSAVIAVGATTIDDERASFSNFGECATIFAPGQDVTSTWVGGNNKINTISGTSMACPRMFLPLCYGYASTNSCQMSPVSSHTYSAWTQTLSWTQRDWKQSFSAPLYHSKPTREPSLSQTMASAAPTPHWNSGNIFIGTHR